MSLQNPKTHTQTDALQTHTAHRHTHRHTRTHVYMYAYTQERKTHTNRDRKTETNREYVLKQGNIITVYNIISHNKNILSLITLILCCKGCYLAHEYKCSA